MKAERENREEFWSDLVLLT